MISTLVFLTFYVFALMIGLPILNFWTLKIVDRLSLTLTRRLKSECIGKWLISFWFFQIVCEASFLISMLVYSQDIQGQKDFGSQFYFGIFLVFMVLLHSGLIFSTTMSLTETLYTWGWERDFFGH